MPKLCEENGPAPASPTVPKPAATVALLRDSPRGVEVLLQRRHREGDFGGAWVFPGGIVSPGDADPALRSRMPGLDPSRAERVGARGDAAYSFWAAALRECFEESGVLIGGRAARDGTIEPLSPAELDSLAAWRGRLDRGERSLHEFLAENDLVLDAAGVRYFSFWTTPVERARRYATRFFACRVPSGAAASVDGREAVQHRWMTPRDALQARRERQMTLHPPTVSQLGTLDSGTTTAVLLDRLDAIERGGVVEIVPELVTSGGKTRIIVRRNGSAVETDV